MLCDKYAYHFYITFHTTYTFFEKSKYSETVALNDKINYWVGKMNLIIYII